MRSLFAAAALSSVGLWLAACGDPSVDRPDGGSIFMMDAAVDPPMPPRVDPVAARQPYRVVTVRGTADARRVIVDTPSSSPVATTVLPDGSYCLDYALPAPGTYVFTARALDEVGLSADTAPFTVEYDPAAPPIAGARTCSGADPAGCQGAVEICGNGRDDDCNSLTDAADPNCQVCHDDPLEPNETPSAPRITPGHYDGLMICPQNQDYYSVFARMGETITARISFVHQEGDLDLALFAPDRSSVLKRSATQANEEQLTHTATAAGEYPLRVYGAGGVANGYVLDLTLTP